MRTLALLLVSVVWALSCATGRVTHSRTHGPSHPSADGGAFLDAWQGDWRGRVHVLRGADTLQSVGMTLAIRSVDSAGCYTWGITYETGGTSDVRPYLICPADTLDARFVIDERNGIVLEAYRLGSVLCSRFDVMGNLLFARDELRGDTIYHEIVSGGLAPKPTGDTVLPKGDTIPAVGSYALSTRQAAKLTRSP